MACKIIGIAHGLSEQIMLKDIGSRMKLDIEVISKQDGQEAIKLEHIGGVLTEYPFDSERSLHKAYPKMDYRAIGSLHMPDIRIYPVMDRDGDLIRVGSYLSGDMFRDSCFHGRIIPILNIDNLDAVLEYSGYGPIKHKTRDYRRLFSAIDIREFYRNMVENPRTNLDVFLYECMKSCPPYQGLIQNGEIEEPKGIDITLLRK